MNITKTYPNSFLNRLRKKISRSIWRGPDSVEDLIESLRTAGKKEIFEREVQDIVERVLRVSVLQVRDVMVPRVLMKTIFLDSTLSEILKIVTSSGHSRFPVINELSADTEAEGILLAKDILAYISESQNEEFNLYDSLRQVMYVPESMRLNILLKRFQERRSHMAIVINEYNSIAGLVTIEDVLEQIVGDIEDELDLDEAEMITKISDDHYNVHAYTDIEDFNKELEVNFPNDVDTIGGRILKEFGYVPTVGETFEIDGLQFKIASADQRRIMQLRVTRNQPHDSNSG